MIAIAPAPSSEQVAKLWRFVASAFRRPERCLCGHSVTVHTRGYPYHCRRASCACPCFVEAKR